MYSCAPLVYIYICMYTCATCLYLEIRHTHTQSPHIKTWPGNPLSSLVSGSLICHGHLVLGYKMNAFWCIYACICMLTWLVYVICINRNSPLALELTRPLSINHIEFFNSLSISTCSFLYLICNACNI